MLPKRKGWRITASVVIAMLGSLGIGMIGFFRNPKGNVMEMESSTIEGEILKEEIGALEKETEISFTWETEAIKDNEETSEMFFLGETIAAEEEKQIKEAVSTFISCKYSVDYHALQNKDSILEWVSAFGKLTVLGVTWRGGENTYASGSEYATAYWNVLMDTGTVMTGMYHPESIVALPEGYVLSRGVLQLQILSCSDLESLSDFLQFEGILACGEYTIPCELVLEKQINALQPGGIYGVRDEVLDYD